MKKRKKGSSLNNKLNRILQLQQLQLKNQEKLNNLEKLELRGVEYEEEQLREINKHDKNIEDQLKGLEELEQEIKRQVGEHPLRKITYKDLGKSMIGAFVGIVSHFTVLEGIHYAETITLAKANGFYVVSFLIGFIMLYYTGFRKIKNVKILSFLPLRLLLVYLVTIFSILLVLLIIGSTGHGFLDIYKSISVLMLPAIIGACAADLIGGE